MASAIDKRPNLRISDVEELMRETGMDQSDTGIGIVNYFRRRQADFHRGRLFDGSDNQINFRLDNLQPVQHQPAQSQPLAASTDDAENSANVAMEAEAAVVLVRPLSELSVADSRVPLFVSAGRAASNSPARSTSRPLTSTVCSPPGRSTVHVSPMVSMSNRKSSNNLQRELVLQKHKRENQMKMEFLRNTASQLASSTPIAGERSERRGENLLDLRETISPIHEDTVQTTPVHATRPVSGVHREKQVSPSGPSTTHARAIRTPIPATQDAPDGMDRAGRETTPPPQLNENGVVVVPETPSPVRKSSRIPNTPLSGLSLTKRTSHLAIPGVLAYLGKGKSPRTIEVRSSAPSTPSRSILKNRTSRLNSTKHRVSFSEQLFVVRESPPSSKSSHMTSDEDEVQDIVNDPANPVQERAGDGEENAQQLRELFRVSRSNAVEEWDENALQETPERHNNRTNGDAVNMIMDDWNETESRRMELNEPQEDRELPVAQRTINNSIAITNIDTPRTVMMDIFDPPSAFCDVDEPALEVPPSQEPSQSRKRKAEEEGGIGGDGNDDNDSSSSARRSSIHENNDQMPRVSPRKICKPTSNVTINNTHHTERLMSVDSPNDHVPLDMIQAVDMIHSRVNSELGVNPGGARELADERRITLNIPSKRRTIKTKVHPDAELYIKTIENACSQERITNHQRKDRRKLFAHQMSEAQKENEADDEPQPLPATQDTVDSVVQADNQQNQLLYGLKSLIVPVQRLSLNTINRAINPDVVDTKEMDINAQREQAAIESPIQEKQNEEQNEKGDRPKRIDRGEQNDESADEEWDRPAKGKSKRDQRDDVVSKEQNRPAKGKSNREKRNDVKSKGKSKRVQYDDEIDLEQDRECSDDDIVDTEHNRRERTKSNRDRHEEVVDMEQNRTSKVKSKDESKRVKYDDERAKSNRDRHEEVVDMEQNRTSKAKSKGKSKRVQYDDEIDLEQDRECSDDDIVDTEQNRRERTKSNRDRHEEVVDMEQNRTSKAKGKGKSKRVQYDDEMDLEQDRELSDDDIVDTAQNRPDRVTSNRDRHEDVVLTEQDRPERGKSKSKNNAKKKKQSRKSDVMFDKYLKNISNEIRHQIESEGPRRSHRNRRLAAEILRNNPNTLQTDAPKYVMPTIKDVLKYYQLSVKPSSKSKSKGQTSSKTANHKESEIVKKSKENVPPTVTLPDGEKKPKTRGRPKKDPRTEPEMFDADGFRVPPIPMGDAIPGSSSAVECSEMVDSSSPNLPPGVSIDSGLSSAVMTGDDAPTKMKKRTKISSKQHTAADQQEPCCSYDSSSLNPPTTREVMDEKRKTLDWMMMLMEKQPYRPPALPMVEVQGFTHLSLEHLVFHEKDGIGYSFYVYSNGDNFGFLRFPPNTSKRSTRTRGCSLKFLILSGSADFSINEVRVTAVGGDFLMIPLDSSYYIVNGPATTLMFMIKSSADLRLSENTVG